MISQTSEYALRAMVHLSKYPIRKGAQTTQQIAEATQVPVGYLSKVLQTLNRVGLLTSQRGLGGGFSLAQSPEEITVFDIVQAIEPVKRIKTCPLGLEAHKEKLCPLHKKLDQIAEQLEQAYQETTLSHLLDGSDYPVVRPVCPPFNRELPSPETKP